MAAYEDFGDKNRSCHTREPNPMCKNHDLGINFSLSALKDFLISIDYLLIDHSQHKCRSLPLKVSGSMIYNTY
jgi:hypothetical protein